MFRTIGWRIFWSFSLVLVALAFVIGISSLELTQKLVEESAANQLRVQSISLSNQVQRHLRRMEANLRQLQTNPTLLDKLTASPSDRVTLTETLTRRLSTMTSVEDFFLFDVRGNGLAATDTDWTPFNASKEQFFSQGLKSYHFGNIYNSPDEGVIQMVSIPVTANGTVLGVLAAQVNLSIIYDLMDQKLGVSENVEAFLLDRNLRFITPGKTGADDLQQSHLAATPLQQRLNSREEYWVGKYKNFMNNEVLGTVIRIPGFNWYIAIEKDYREVESQMSGILRGIAIATGGLLLVLLGTTWLLTRSITRPVQALVESAQRISMGDFTHPIKIPARDDEIAFLALEFDKMRAKVAASQGRLIEKLEESEQLRIESERLAAIGTLAATLAHEIRNPLNAMALLLAQLERRATPEDPSLRIVLQFRGEIQRLNKMVDSILDYSKPVRLEVRPLRLAQVVKEVLALYQGTLETQNIRVIHDLDREQSEINGDPDKLKQCFMNVFQNAIDAIGFSGTIHVATARKKPGHLELLISDSGPGFPAQGTGRLFDLFYTTKEKGTGLGLSTVRKIVDAHRATITLENAQPKGGIVRIDFPTIPRSSHV